MSKYIIELDDRIKLVTSVGVTENGVVYTTSDYVYNLEELNSDYINEHYGELQDEAYQKGFEDGKKSVSETDRIEVGDEVISDTGAKAGTKFTVTVFANSDTVCGFSERGLWCFNTIDKLTKTGKHYDIASILEAMRE